MGSRHRPHPFCKYSLSSLHGRAPGTWTNETAPALWSSWYNSRDIYPVRSLQQQVTGCSRVWCSREQRRKGSVLLWGEDSRVLHHRVPEPMKSRDACHLGRVFKAQEIACTEAGRCCEQQLGSRAGPVLSWIAWVGSCTERFLQAGGWGVGAQWTTEVRLRMTRISQQEQVLVPLPRVVLPETPWRGGGGAL